ncbi:MAG: hypothetical protein H0U36_07355, partial [Nocardioidaceae bacterium]|nr:hypothetical protein [Nocardioidaceae bacterium]
MINPRVNRRTFMLGALVVAGTGSLASCTDESPTAGTSSTGPVPRPTLRIPGGDFGFPSPFGYIAGPGYIRMSLIYDSLLWKDGSGELQPWLASSYNRSDDGLAYTFTLREAQWHDGEPLTVGDVEFTFAYFAQLVGKLPPLVLAQPFGVTSAKATDARTVEVTLAAPMEIFLQQVAGSLPILPQHIWSAISNPATAQELENLVGTGPYRLESYTSGEGSYLYTANDAYFLGKPFVKRVELLPVGDELQALRASSTDAAETPPTGVTPDALAPLRSDDVGLASLPGGFAFPLYWNLVRGGALADVTFRRACALAIDREDIVTRLVGGQGLAGNPGFLPPDHPDFVDVEQYSFDVEAANTMLDDAGYERSSGTAIRQLPDGTPLRFELLTGGELPVIELVIQSLKAIGVEVVPKNVELATFYGLKFSGEWDMVITLYPGPGGQGPESDPDQLRLVYSSQGPPSPAQVSGHGNPEVDQLCQAQLVTADPTERSQIIGKIQQLVAQDLPVLPL